MPLDTRGGRGGVAPLLAALALAVVVADAAPAVPPPGASFNLTSYTLQLPVAAPGGGVQEVKWPALATYTSKYFYTDPADGAMTFFAPENGATTSGSKYPRSELRQNVDFDLSQGSRHVLNATLAVTATAGGTAITIGQAHVDGLSGSCSIFVELEWTAAGDVVAHLRDKACDNVSKTVGSGYKLGDKITYSIVVEGDTAVVTTDSGSMAPYAYAWLKTSTPVYFKAGDYFQGTGSSSTLGGTVKVYSLSTSHSN